MRYFKANNCIFEVTDDLTKWRWIYNLITQEHIKDTWWGTYPHDWKDDIELTKAEVFIKLL